MTDVIAQAMHAMTAPLVERIILRALSGAPDAARYPEQIGSITPVV